MSGSRRDRTPQSRLTYRESVAARRHAREVTERHYATARRAPHPQRDPALTEPLVIKTRMVRQAAAIVDNDRELVRWVEGLLDEGRKDRRGRPREISVRTALICFLLHVIVHNNFNLLHVPATIGSLNWRVRRNLGIDRRHNGVLTQVSYDQMLRIFHDIAEVFDAWSKDLITEPDETGTVPAEALAAEQAERDRRAANLQEFTDRLLSGSLANAPIGSGNVALDATLKWCHERPNGQMNSKIERLGVDGDAGSPLPLSAIVGGSDEDVDRSLFATVSPFEVVHRSDDTTPDAGHSSDETTRSNTDASPDSTKAEPASAGDGAQEGRRSGTPKYRPATWGLGSAWVGRANKKKSVYGIALHSVVRADGPCLVETFTVTPANGDPAEAVMPILRRLHDRRAATPAVIDLALAGQIALLGDVIADGGYTGARAENWHLPIKALGATPIGRLHRTNQEGARWHNTGRGKRVGKVMTLGGRPMCECAAHSPLAEVRFPKFPYKTSELLSYQRQIALLDRYEWRPNGPVRPDGSQQWLAPHRQSSIDGNPGGCEDCTNTDGSPKMDESGRPKPRCCTAPSRILTKDVLALEQGVRFGSESWYSKWKPRNRVEGSFGILKNSSLVGWGRDFHRFVGLAHETLVAAFALCAYNLHMLRSDNAKRIFDETDGAVEDTLPSAQPTQTRPHAGELDRTPPPERPTARRPAKKRRAGPKGLEHLGHE